MEEKIRNVFLERTAVLFCAKAEIKRLYIVVLCEWHKQQCILLHNNSTIQSSLHSERNLKTIQMLLYFQIICILSHPRVYTCRQTIKTSSFKLYFKPSKASREVRLFCVFVL